MRNPSTPSDNSHADIGIACALKIELAPLLSRCLTLNKYTGGDFVFRGGHYEDARIAVVESGPGFARARRATEALIEAHTPTWVLSCGFSGALQPELKLGHIVMANGISDTHGQHFPLDLEIPGSLPQGVHVGRLLTADAIVRTAEEKRTLGEAHDALAVDLESLAVAQVCRDRQVRFMAVRVISDDMDTDLPPEIHSVMGPTTTRRVGAALGALWKRPSSHKDLWKLRETANHAADRLAQFLDGVIEQLYDAIE